jgi:hypothetical protein
MGGAMLDVHVRRGTARLSVTLDTTDTLSPCNHGARIEVAAESQAQDGETPGSRHPAAQGSATGYRLSGD